jgi:hypothetical protein
MGDDPDRKQEEDEFIQSMQMCAIGCMTDRYRMAKGAKVGETVICPTCEKQFIKRSYQQAFCCNRGRGNCKDRYWNVTEDERRERTVERIFG